MRRILTLTFVVVCLSGCGYDPMFESDESAEAAKSDAKATGSKPVQMSDDAFRMAAQKGQADKVRQGIDGGLDVNGADLADGMTALHLAAHDGRRVIVTLLLDNDADVDIRDAQEHTPLLMAAYNGHTDTVRLLHSKGAQVDARDNQGMTALIHASSDSHVETVEFLIESGADINAVDSGEGFTPLMTAAALGVKDVVEILLDHNADKTIKDGDGDTALSHAMTSRNAEIVELLK